MFTVIIGDETTLKYIKDYNLFLKPFEDNNEIALCPWNKNGKDIESAIPSLKDKIKDVKHWRAVVLTTDSIEGLNDLLVDRINPFDYVNEKAQIEEPRESDVPIIRLSHLLGGYRADEYTYVKGIEYSDDNGHKHKEVLKEDQQIETTSKNVIFPIYIEQPVAEEIREKQKELEKKYSSFPNKPNEIIFIATRKIGTEDDKIKLEMCWNNQLETMSSRFWERHKYPNNCRFICFDVSDKEDVSFKKDMFEWFMSILVLSTNKISNDVLQAYRIYRIGVDINEDDLSNYLNSRLDKLDAIKSYINTKINSANIRKEYTIEKQYTIDDVEIIVEMGNSHKIRMKTGGVSLLRDVPEDEIITWENELNQKCKQLEELFKQPKRNVANAADNLKDEINHLGNEVYELDKFQIEDLNEEMQDYKKKIFCFDHSKTINEDEIRKEIEKIDNEYQKESKSRLNLFLLLVNSAIVLLITIIVFLPYIIKNLTKDITGSMSSVVLTSIIIGTMIVGALVVLFIMTLKIKKIRKKMNNLFVNISINHVKYIKEFSRFLTNLMCYAKGKSVLNNVKKCEEIKFLKTVSINRLKKATEQSINRDNELLNVYNINRKYKYVDDISGFFDPELEVEDNAIYFYETNNQKNGITIDESGIKLSAPYMFIDNFSIDRIASFDDFSEQSGEEKAC